MNFTRDWNYTINGQNQDPSIDGVYRDEAREYIAVIHEQLPHTSQFEYRLSIQREDKQPIRSWRLLQDIKNATAGADRIAIEVYPPESDVTDTANIYHLWVYREGLGPRVGLTKPGDPRAQRV